VTLDGVSLSGDEYQKTSLQRGLIPAVTDGTQTDPPYDVVDINAGLHVGHIMAADVSCYSLRTHGEVEYVDTFWEDLRFPSQGINPPGAAADPGVDDDTGLLAFSGTLDNVVAGAAQMPHAWKAGTAIHPHIHMRFPTSAAADTRWLFEYDIANVNDDFTNASGTYTTLSTITVANPQNVNKHAIAGFGNLSMTGFRESAVILWRLSRLAFSDAADTDANDCLLIELDFHFECAKPGTVLEYPTA
jgi:hypothetical protein